ncbi:MAG: transposase, partial [Acidimicrobiales bacterium]
MARRFRHDAAGFIHHVVNRGASRENVFWDREDRLLFLGLLAGLSKKHGIDTLAYCLMGNHYHLVLRCPLGNLSVGVKWFASIYSQRFNTNHGFDGSPFRGRFQSKLIDTDAYLLNAVRYVHKNPLAHGFVPSLNGFEWSSHAAYLGEAQTPSWLDNQMVLGMVHSGGEQYSTFIDQTGEDLDESYEFSREKNLVPIELVEAAVLVATGGQYDNFFHSTNGVRNNDRALLFLNAHEMSGLRDRQVAERYGVANAPTVKDIRRRARLSLERDES